MKPLQISIITIVGIVVIVISLLGIFTEKLTDNQQQPLTDMVITGIKENYALNEPITFSVIIEGYGTACGDTKAIITKENDSQYKSLEWDNSTAQCVYNAKPNYLKFVAISANTSINQAGNYTLEVLYHDLANHRRVTEGKKFSVISFPSTTISDTGIVPFSANVTNTNFTVNYDITGNNKLLDAKMDQQAKSLVLSLETSSNGTLTVIIPRALLDAKINNQDDRFIVLMDGQEIEYKETKTIDNRTLTFQFTQGTSKIEIIATQLI